MIGRFDEKGECCVSGENVGLVGFMDVLNLV